MLTDNSVLETLRGDPEVVRLAEEWRAIPKVELHCHLGGCLSPEEINELLVLSGNKNGAVCAVKAPQTLAECFDVFKAVHTALSTPEGLYLAAEKTVRKALSDNVKFLELRTTPRVLEGADMRGYLDAVLRGAQKVIDESGAAIDVGLVVSVDRSKSFEDGEKGVKLCAELPACKHGTAGVCAVEVSGNPYALGFIERKSILDYARNVLHLPVTVHMAECPNTVEENAAVIAWRPQRLGHAVLLNEKEVRDVVEAKIPVEICLSSNIMSNTITHPAQHPFVRAYTLHQHPVCFCTDDPGVFSTTLSLEMALAEHHCKIPRQELVALQQQAMEFSFAPDDVKALFRGMP